MNVNLFKKVVVITGSSRGLGREMVRFFAKEGAYVVINYKNDEKSAKELFDEIRLITSCIMIKADVSREDDVLSFYHSVIKEFGRVDILINNAGKCSDNYLSFMNLKQWNDVLKTNLTSMYLCSRIFSKNMIANGGGKIINISSLKGQLGSEGQCNYAASKAGVIGLTKSLAKELGKLGVSVNALCPGFIVTDLNRLNPYKAKIAEKMSILKEQRSLDDFLSFILLLSSDCVKGVSGQVFNIDSRIN